MPIPPPVIRQDIARQVTVAPPHGYLPRLGAGSSCCKPCRDALRSTGSDHRAGTSFLMYWTELVPVISLLIRTGRVPSRDPHTSSTSRSTSASQVSEGPEHTLRRNVSSAKLFLKRCTSIRTVLSCVFNLLNNEVLERLEVNRAFEVFLLVVVEFFNDHTAVNSLNQSREQPC